MFEAFFPRKEVIVQDQFAALLEANSELKESVDRFFEQVEFKEDGGETTHYKEGPQFEERFRDLQKALERHGIRATKEAIMRAVFTAMDPDGTEGYVEHL